MFNVALASIRLMAARESSRERGHPSSIEPCILPALCPIECFPAAVSGHGRAGQRHGGQTVHLACKVRKPTANGPAQFPNMRIHAM